MPGEIVRAEGGEHPGQTGGAAHGPSVRRGEQFERRGGVREPGLRQMQVAHGGADVAMAEQALAKAKLAPNVVVDCSHANSYKKPELQPLVMADIVNQIRLGNKSLVGVMIESNIEAGNQPIPADLTQLKYGCSVTDGCVDWDATEKMIRDAAVLLRDVLPERIG